MPERLAAATRETFASFRVRNFRLFFMGQGISQIGNWMTLIAQTLLVLDLTGSGVAVGFLAACQFGPVLLLGAWAGFVADRSDKRRPAAHRPGRGHGAVVPPRPAWPSWTTRRWPRIFAVAVPGRAVHGLRQPGPAGLRRGDGPRRPGPQRRQPEQRHDDQLPGHRPGPGRACSSPPSATAGPSGSTASPTSPCSIGLWLMRTEELRPVDPGRPGQGPGPAGPALRAGHAGARRAPGDDGRASGRCPSTSRSSCRCW